MRPAARLRSTRFSFRGTPPKPSMRRGDSGPPGESRAGVGCPAGKTGKGGLQGLFSHPMEKQKPAKHRVYTMSFASVYPYLVAKAEKKGRTKAEVDEIIRWLTGYSDKGLAAVLKKKTDYETFFAEAPRLNPSRTLIKGVVCGVRVEEVREPLMREIRYLDKLIDELAKGKAMGKILRETGADR